MSITWQPLTWIIFHTFALHYNEEYRDYYINFFETFRKIIPCSICRNHYNQNINRNSMSLQENINKDRIFNWTVDLHNNVNQMNHKRSWSYDEAKDYYIINNFNNKILKIFLYEYVKSNFKKNPEKTNNLIEMLKTIPYIHPEEDKRQKLIEFKEKFDLNRITFKKWLLAFVLILTH